MSKPYPYPVKESPKVIMKLVNETENPVRVLVWGSEVYFSIAGMSVNTFLRACQHQNAVVTVCGEDVSLRRQDYSNDKSFINVRFLIDHAPLDDQLDFLGALDYWRKEGKKVLDSNLNNTSKLSKTEDGEFSV